MNIPKFFCFSLFKILLLSSTILFHCSALHIDDDEIEQQDDADYLNDDRGFVVTTGLTFGNVLGLNLTGLVPFFALSSIVFIPLLILGIVTLIFYGKALYYKKDYSDYSRSFGIDYVNWDQISIIDWIHIAEETFRKFDPTDIECHKKVICEIHQNVKSFGKIGARFVNAFGYLHYFESFGLPLVIMDIVNEYVDAAERGRSLKKTCDNIYENCNFSVKKIQDDISQNEIK